MDQYLCDWSGANRVGVLEVTKVSVGSDVAVDGDCWSGRIRWWLAGVYNREWNTVLGL